MPIEDPHVISPSLPKLTSEVVEQRLQALATTRIRLFTQKLVPTIDPGTVLGVTIPHIRQLAKELVAEYDTTDYLATLPHTHFEELALHGIMVCMGRDFASVLAKIQALLPHINDWSSCDTLSPKVFAKHCAALLPTVETWLEAQHEYTVRFAVIVLMKYYLTPEDAPRAMQLVEGVCREEYYIRMAQAWFWAEALVKQPDLALPRIEQRRFSAWVHAKAIQKARESRRVPAELKEYLLSLR